MSRPATSYPRRAEDHPWFETAGPIGLAHRGGALHPANAGRENTLAAFRTAVDLGYRYLETDVHATADGTLVAFHDTVLDRVTDRAGAIADLPWARVSEASVGGEPVPTMDAVLEELPDARFNVDVKDDRAVDPLVDCLRRHDALDRVCVASFSDRRLRRVRAALGPRVATSAGPIGVGVTRLTPRLLDRWLRSPALALQIPTHQRIPLRGGRPLTIELVTDRLVRRAHAAGRHVHVWTIDDRDEMHRLLDLGVDGIVSDRIEVLADVLAERGAPLR